MKIIYKQAIWFDINFQCSFRSTRSTIVKFFLAVTALVLTIYLLAKIWQECKQRRNHIVEASLVNIVHHPCLNNLKFNPIIVKSKTFLFHSILSLMFISASYFSVQTRLKTEGLDLLINFYLSIVIPLNIYLKNPSLKKYLRNDLLNDLCLWIVLTVFNIEIKL